MNAEARIDLLLNTLGSKNLLRDGGQDPCVRPVPQIHDEGSGRRPDAIDGSTQTEGWTSETVPEGLLGRAVRKFPSEELDERDELGGVDDVQWPFEDFSADFDDAWDDEEIDGLSRDGYLGEMNGTRGLSGIADAYAWYCPYHTFTTGYGIYVRDDGLEAVARGLIPLVPGYLRRHISQNGQKRQAYKLLHRAAFYYFCLHEFYHHKTESFATRLELVSNSPAHIPYMQSVYGPAAYPVLTDSLIEEGLAVAEVMRCLKGAKTFRSKSFWGHLGRDFSVRDVLIKFVEWEMGAFSNLPAGYRLACQYLMGRGHFNRAGFEADQCRLMSLVQEATNPPLRDPAEWHFCEGMFAGFQPDLLADASASCAVNVVSKNGTPIGALPRTALSASKVMRVARDWKIRRSDRVGKGDHVWLENNLGDQDHIDTGRTDITASDWTAILGLVSLGWSVDLKNNEAGRNIFMAGPKRCGAKPAPTGECQTTSATM